MSKKRRSKDEWAEICADYGSSGETAAAFARRRGLKRSTLLWWNSWFRREGLVDQKTNGFVELVAEAPQTRNRTLVRLGSVTVEFEDAVPPASWIAELAARC